MLFYYCIYREASVWLAPDGPTYIIEWNFVSGIDDGVQRNPNSGLNAMLYPTCETVSNDPHYHYLFFQCCREGSWGLQRSDGGLCCLCEECSWGDVMRSPPLSPNLKCKYVKHFSYAFMGNGINGKYLLEKSLYLDCPTRYYSADLLAYRYRKYKYRQNTLWLDHLQKCSHNVLVRCTW